MKIHKAELGYKAGLPSTLAPGAVWFGFSYEEAPDFRFVFAPKALNSGLSETVLLHNDWKPPRDARIVCPRCGKNESEPRCGNPLSNEEREEVLRPFRLQIALQKKKGEKT